MKVKLVIAGDKFGVQITRGWLFKDVKYADLNNQGYEWKINARYIKDCWGTYDQAKFIYQTYNPKDSGEKV